MNVCPSYRLRRRQRSAGQEPMADPYRVPQEVGWISLELIGFYAKHSPKTGPGHWNLWSDPAGWSWGAGSVSRTWCESNSWNMTFILNMAWSQREMLIMPNIRACKLSFLSVYNICLMIIKTAWGISLLIHVWKSVYSGCRKTSVKQTPHKAIRTSYQPKMQIAFCLHYNKTLLISGYSRW